MTKKTIHDLMIENKKLKTELANAKRQIAKTNIKDFLEKFFEIELDSQALVDLVLDEEGGNLTSVGRPKIPGANKSQMRHVIPYGFVEKLIKNKIQTKKHDEIIKSIGEGIKILINSQKGFCISEKEYNKEWYQITKAELGEISERKLSTNKDNYYFLTLKSGCYDFFKYDYEYKDELNQARLFYKEKSEKFLDSSLKLLSDSIIDENTRIIAIEQLARAVCTIFNQRTNAAFPDEKNTLNYTIRLFESTKDAKYTGKEYKKYTLLTSDEVKTKIDEDKKDKLNLKIRIVKDEGTFLIFVLKALEILNKLMAPNKITEENLIGYNDLKYNEQPPQFNFILSKPCNTILDIKNFEKYCSFHVAKYLYAIFDFKPLEENVFVECNKYGTGAVKVYGNATAVKASSYYKIMHGKEYRDNQEIPKGKYNVKLNPPKFRSELKKDEEKKILTKLAVEHMLIAKETFKNFNKDKFKISEAFYKLIEDKYGFKKEFSMLLLEKEAQINKQSDTTSEVNVEHSTINVAASQSGADNHDISILELLGLD